jgi:hypothetical protein
MTHLSLLHPQMDAMSSLPNDLLHIPVDSDPIPQSDLHHAVHVFTGVHILKLSSRQDLLKHHDSSNDLYKFVFSECIWIYVN